MSRTAPQSTSNALTPSFSTVSSTAGFQAGDLIYAKDSAYGVIPNNAVTTANFPITGTVSLGRTPYNSTIVNVAESPNYSIGASGRGDNSAILSNGNVVVVGSNTSAGNFNNYVYFRIIDQNFSEVVASTQIGSTQPYYGQVSVCALTGGGFVVTWATGSGPTPYYAIYSNSGSAVLATTAVPGMANTYYTNIKALANGGFVIASVNTSAQPQCRTFNSSGTAVSSLQTFGSYSYSSQQPLIATFSDSSFSICGSNTSTITIYNCNTLGSFTTSTAVATDFYNSAGGYSFTTLSDGTALLAYTENTNGYIRALKYTPSTTSVAGLGYLNSSTASCPTVTVQGLSGGNFILLASTGSANTTLMRYWIYTNAGSSVTSLNIVGLSIDSAYPYSYNTTVLEGSTYVMLMNANPNGNFPSAGIAGAQVLKASPYTIRSFNSTSIQLATASAAVSGYARSNSTPNSASFLAASTQTLSVSVSPSSGTSFQLTPYAPTADTIRVQSMVTMQNGQFVNAYTTSTAVKCIVFNSDGSVSQTFTVATGSFSGPVNAITLGNGKLVIAYPAATNSVGISIYSTSYSLLATGSTLATAAGSSIDSLGGGFSMAAIDNTRFVIGYNNSSGVSQVVVFDDTCAALYSTNTGISSGYPIHVGAMPGGNFFIEYFYPAAGYSYVTNYARNGSGSTYSSMGTSAISPLNDGAYSLGSVMLPSGTGCYVVGYAGSTYLCRFNAASPASRTYEYLGGSITNNNTALCVGSSGNLMVFQASSADRRYRLYSPGNTTNVQSGSQGTYYLNNSITLSDYNTGSDTFASAPAVTCLYGDTYAFSYRTSSNTMKVGLLSTASATYSTTITGGVTASNTALTPSQSNGYYLAGVSTSACAAGGTGVIQTNGAATLSSSYPAGTTAQAFDFTSPTVPVGVKGTIAGRNLTIQGS